MKSVVSNKLHELACHFGSPRICWHQQIPTVLHPLSVAPRHPQQPHSLDGYMSDGDVAFFNANGTPKTIGATASSAMGANSNAANCIEVRFVNAFRNQKWNVLGYFRTTVT